MLAAAFVCGGCGDPKEAQDFVHEKSGEIRVAIPINMKAETTKTLAYWTKAIAEVSICRDFVVGKTPLEKRTEFSWPYIGHAVTQELRKLPAEGVDPEAVKSVQMVADVFDDLRKIDKVVMRDADDIGSAIGGSVARGLAGSGNSASNTGAGAAAAGDLATKIALSNAAKTILSNSDLAGLASIKGFLSGSEAERKLEKGTDARLEASRETLQRKYHIEFPEFAVTSKMGSNVQFSGVCGISLLDHN